jgi:HEAT repeat protein
MLEKKLEDLAQRCAVNGTTNEADLETLRSFFECRQNITRLLNDFAPVCDRLAELAQKSLTGQALTDDDAKWIENYGVTLAGFHFYHGNSYEVPRDDFPIVTRVFSDPLTSSMLYAGLARPQSLYIILPAGKTGQLYRGAVMTYREFVRPNTQLLDDESWRELVSKGQTPPAPPFTRSFYAETSVPELIKRLSRQSENENVNRGDTEDILWQIGSRATEKDLPDLLEVLVHTQGEERGDIVDGIAGVIGQLPWKSHQKQFIELLASPDDILANASASILIGQPAVLDPGNFISGFAHQSPRVRRLYCAIISHLPQQPEATRQLLLPALHDPVDGVRWQAVLAIEKTGWNDAQRQAALLETLNDTNEFVSTAAAYSLAQLGATNAAPTLLAKLKATLQSTNTPPEVREHQALEISRDLRGEGNHAVKVLDPDNLGWRLHISADVTANVRSMAARRLPPMPFNRPDVNYDLTTALIGALGDLGYSPAADELFKLRGTDYDPEATRALTKLAPDRLTRELVATAKDKQIDSYLREKAMVALCDIAATNRVHDLVPLLDDTTPIDYERVLPGPEWRVCDRAAETIAILQGWENGRFFMHPRPGQREAMMNRVREWAKQAQ